MKKKIHIIVAGMTATSFLMLNACQSSGEAWSTKDQSITSGSNPTLNQDPDPIAVNTDAADGGALREAAIDLLREASAASDPLLRANAIEAMHHAPESIEPFVQAGLGDENRGVRFIAAMTAGKLQLESLSNLVYPLLQDESPSVQAAAIYALHRCGERVNPGPLAQMLESSNPEVKANAAMVLGELGNDSAVPMLRNAVGRGLSRVSEARTQIVDLQIAEAMVKLGDDRQLEVIRATLFAPAEQGELVALACQMVASIGDVRAVPNLLQLALRDGQRRLPAEVRMAATHALAQLDPAQAPLEVPMEFVDSNRFEHRAQAALTLGAISDEQSLSALRQLLNDDHPMVQVFAAGGILQAAPEAESLPEVP